MSENRKKLLLHSCCGPCSTAVIERLVEDFDVTVFYYNPNITDSDEYLHRKSEEERFIREYCANTGRHIDYIDGEYCPAEYLEYVKGLENEPEGGMRCKKCFELRLAKTAELAKKLNFDCFDTTLTVSPYKNYDNISVIASKLADEYAVEYLSGNYKKQNGYQRSIELSKEYGLYRQHYCGCDFSKHSLESRGAES